MDTDLRETRLEEFDWSVRTLNVFNVHGLATVADLLALSDDELLAFQGFGRNSLREVHKFRSDWHKTSRSADSEDGPQSDTSISLLELHDWSVRTLNVFRNHSIETVADLLETSDSELLSMQNFGRKSLREVNEFKKSWRSGITPQTAPRQLDDSTSNHIMIPLDQDLETGQQLLEAMPEILGEIAQNLADPVHGDILLNRLAKIPREKKTLEEIGTSAVKKITRERVRQKERHLIQKLSRALVSGFYSNLGFQFSPHFTQWWELAAEFFGDREEIDFDEFVSDLCEIWEVDAGYLIEHLPFILAIVTGDSKFPEGFRTATRLDYRFYGNLPDETSNLPLSKLRLNKYASHLQELGLSTLGEFVEATRIGLLDEIQGRATQKTLDHLVLLASCLNETGLIDWHMYQDALELPRIPDTPPQSPVEFLSTLEANVLKVIETEQPMHRSTEIFRIRTSRVANHRPTLARTAEILRTHSPTIKREETVLLQHLNDLFLLKDFSNAPIWLDAAWLDYWHTVANAFDQNPQNPGVFAKELAMKWSLPVEKVENAIPILWAVLTGYPKGRPTQKVHERENLPPASPQKVGRIKLRGFRRVH